MTEEKKDKRPHWSSAFAFVLATASSAIGLGNLWRFPYLAAQYGGGIFIITYLVFVITFGFTLMLAEVALGRNTRQSSLTAISSINKKWGWIGFFMLLSPIIIFPIYCVISGWVLFYLKTYFVMMFSQTSPFAENALMASCFFKTFVSSPLDPLCYSMVFLSFCVFVSSCGIKKGIEKANLIAMPILFLLIISFAIYVFFIPGTMEGVKYYLIPNLDSLKSATGEISISRCCKLLIAALGQVFFSLSCCSGILMPFGSYMNRKDSIEKSLRRVEFLDTLVALLAGMIIVPVVYVFASKTGTSINEAMGVGAGLMFVTLPEVFSTFGNAEAYVGFAFFLLVTFAAITSGFALVEAIVSPIIDRFNMSRRHVSCYVFVLIALILCFVSLRESVLKNVKLLGMNLLAFFDFLSSSILLPITALGICIFVAWVMKPTRVIAECRVCKNEFKSQRLFVFVIKYLAPIFLLALLISEICNTFHIGGWRV